MIKTNRYFDGKVASLGAENSSGKWTLGVMLAGEYEFETSTEEQMTLLSGRWEVRLPYSEEFTEYPVHESFEIPAGEKFQLKVLEDSGYLCRYL
ncbi:MAG: pyrimidine/purine nucleoside phosphorylase [Fibrobacter sp.]|jgi:uncharacterized protein YaiE (UPF0345 family)|nr:pyrimidine/purine nucleoside phosphorylase [Fibrobacter sp.]